MKKTILILDLKGYRKRERLTQTDLAEKLGITQSAVSQFENNQQYVRLSTINRIAEKLGVEVSRIVVEVTP